MLKRINEMFWVYILRCADDSYYTGHINNLERRIGQYETQECVTREDALSAGMQTRAGVARRKKP